MAFEQLSQKVAHHNPFYSIYQEDYRLPNNEVGTYYGIRGLETVFVLPMLSKTHLVVLKQFRYLLKDYSWEFTAGKLDDGEEVEVGARRELQEETGYQAGQLHYAGWFSPCNGLSDERCHVYLATELEGGEQHLEDSEDISIHVKSIDEWNQMIDNNEVHDGMSITAWRMTERIREQLNKD